MQLPLPQFWHDSRELKAHTCSSTSWLLPRWEKKWLSRLYTPHIVIFTNTIRNLWAEQSLTQYFCGITVNFPRHKEIFQKEFSSHVQQRAGSLQWVLEISYVLFHQAFMPWSCTGNSAIAVEQCKCIQSRINIRCGKSTALLPE